MPALFADVLRASDDHAPAHARRLTISPHDVLKTPEKSPSNPQAALLIATPTTAMTVRLLLPTHVALASLTSHTTRA